MNGSDVRPMTARLSPPTLWVPHLVIAVLCAVLFSSGTALTPSVAHAKRGIVKDRQGHTIGQESPRLPWRRVPAHSILLKDLNSGRVLYEHEPGKRLSPASLTKIMSALVILERGRMDDLVTVSPTASRAPKTHLRLKAGQVFRRTSGRLPPWAPTP